VETQWIRCNHGVKAPEYYNTASYYTTKAPEYYTTKKTEYYTEVPKYYSAPAY
jgi:hypothetical protein